MGTPVAQTRLLRNLLLGALPGEAALLPEWSPVPGSPPPILYDANAMHVYSINKCIMNDRSADEMIDNMLYDE